MGTLKMKKNSLSRQGSYKDKRLKNEGEKPATLKSKKYLTRKVVSLSMHDW